MHLFATLSLLLPLSLFSVASPSKKGSVLPFGAANISLGPSKLYTPGKVCGIHDKAYIGSKMGYPRCRR
jgi:hypothetical protein